MSIKALLAFFPLLLCFASALSLDEEAGFFASSGETIALSNFSYGGAAYHLLKINGEPAVIFGESNGTYSAVAEDALLAVLVPALMKTQPMPIDAGVVEGVKANYNLVNQEVGTCVAGVNAFYSCTTPPPFACAYMWITILPDYPTMQAEVKKMDVAFPGLKQGMADMTSGVSGVEAAFNSNDVDGLASAASTVYNAVSAIQTGFNTIAASHSAIKTNFPYSFDYWNQTSSVAVKANCTASSALSSALASLSTFAASTKSLSTGDTLAKIRSATLSRNASAAAKKTYFFKAEEFKPVSTNARKVLADLGSAGLVATGFNNEFTRLNGVLEGIQNASTPAEVDAKARDFDAQKAAFEAKTRAYAELAPVYNSSVKLKANASAQISKAAKQYGLNSAFVAPLAKQYSATTTSLKSVQDNLAAGQNVSMADLQAIKANYSQIISYATGLKPKESQVDWVIIGGVLAIVLAVIGTVVYFKKFKPRFPSMGGKTERVLDIRQLQSSPKPPSQGPAIEGPPWIKRP